MSSLQVLNPRADLLRKHAATAANLNAAVGLQSVLETNLGPKGSLKMLVGGAGTFKITKDGNVLLQEMQIQHPTASLIARAATAQDAATGDGTTATVIVIGELMKKLAGLVEDNVHARVLCDGLEIARKEALAFLDTFTRAYPNPLADRDLCHKIVKTSLATKLPLKSANQLTDIVVDAIACIANAPAATPPADAAGAAAAGAAAAGAAGAEEALPLDLHMIEVIAMRQGLSSETRFVKGMVMDHGTRHPDMPHRLKNCFILTCNVSLEYEKSEVNASFFYSSAEEREKLAIAERRFTDEKVRKLIELKKLVCKTPDQSFVVLNQKGIDPPSLDMLAKEGIMALRRVKRRNMERLVLCCGGHAVNCFDDLSPEDLGWAGSVWETSMADDKWTFVEEVKNPRSCTILVKGPNEHVINQIKDAIRDGLRSLKNAIDDKKLVPGAGAFELACAERLKNLANGTNGAGVQGKPKLAVEAFAEALLVVPRALAKNSGFDPADSIIKMQDEFRSKKNPIAEVGFNIDNGDVTVPSVEGIWDNYRVKRQLIQLVSALVSQLMLVDEIMRAGRQMGRG